ncbi:MAG: class I SAM-dependent methyltransferase [Rhodospirillaceae bacterium]|nr:class I SAM-dependent methyltransferase [Rhodospirillaceae bacterium]
MTDPKKGYITEVPYPNVYHRELNPSFHALALNANGLSSPSRVTPYTYLELGCAWGLSTLIHAAANPDSKFVGVDFNGECIAAANEIAKEAKLTNVEFLQADFADLPDRVMPGFDTIVMHGVWGWIDQKGRDQIVRILDRHLKPEGHAFISYNAMPGNAPVDALRRLLQVGFELGAEPLFNKVNAGVGIAGQVKDNGARFFAAHPMMAERMDHMIKPAPRDYLAHEYFNADWQPFYFTDVQAQLSPAGLAFAGSAHLLDLIDDAQLPEAARNHIAGAPTIGTRETLRDFYINTLFRRDLWRRGQVAQTKDSQDALMTTKFVIGQGVEHFDRIAGHAMLGEVRPKADPGRAVVAVLESGPKTAVEVSQDSALAGVELGVILETMMVLAAVGAAEPILPEAGFAARKESCKRLNMALAQRTLSAAKTGGREWQSLASPVTGGGVATNAVIQAFILAGHQGVEPMAFAASFAPDDAPAADVQEHIRKLYEVFERESGTTFGNLGIV